MKDKIVMVLVWICLGLFIWWIDYEENKEERKIINYYVEEAIDKNPFHASIESTWSNEFEDPTKYLTAPKFD
jgi:hypothetical protein